MQKGIIDRFEGDLAVIEIEDSTIDVPRKKLPFNAQIGDQLIIDGNHITIDKKATKKLRKDIDALADDLFEE